MLIIAMTENDDNESVDSDTATLNTNNAYSNDNNNDEYMTNNNNTIKPSENIYR